MRRILIVLLLLGTVLNGQTLDCSQCHTDDVELVNLLNRQAGIFQKAVGVMDKGQLQNNTGNFGSLANFLFWFTNAAHWPRNADPNRQYAFGLGLLLGIDSSNVLETETQTMGKIQDWLPPDDALGLDYSGDVRAISDDTPFQASSDLPKTWPAAFWPGYFRVDVNQLDEDQLAAHPDAYDLTDAPNQFVSDRDVFCTYNDAGNPAGNHGITVEQTGYSYGRAYAEDILFWELKIFNDGGEDLNDIHVGFYSKFRPDYDNHDYLQFRDSDGDGRKDLVVTYDVNNELDGVWNESDDPLGMVGLRIYDTPGQLGITDFHHFARAASPTTDAEFWALMTSDPDTSVLSDPAFYFHGPNSRIDDTATDSLSSYYPAWSADGTEAPRIGNAINTIVSCGPFDLPADSHVTVSLGLIMGDAGTIPGQPDMTDLMNNVVTANEMYRLYFQGPAPPPSPVVHASAGDGRVTLRWDGLASESAMDPWTGEQDFEGYKVFRSTDRGQTWGRPITDFEGNLAGYEPIAIFDYTEAEDMERFGRDISGADPLYPQSLGDNRGLRHVLVDSNLINGVEYWYCVTAYDKGVVSDTLELASLMSALGASTFEEHTVAVTPGRRATTLADERLEPLSGQCDGVVRLEIVDRDALKNHEYELSFEENVAYLDADSARQFGTALNLVDLTTGDSLVTRRLIAFDSDTNFVAADGFLLYLEHAPRGVRSMGWTRVAADTCTFEWRLDSKYPEWVASGRSIGRTIETYDDYRITVDLDGGLEAAWYDWFSGEYQPEPQHLPIRVEVVTDPENPMDVSENTTLVEFAIQAPPDYRNRYYSILGWDLEPGGTGWLEAEPGFRELYPDFLILERRDIQPSEADPAVMDTIASFLYLFTDHKPDSSLNRYNEWEVIDARGPSDGDQFTIETTKTFSEQFVYRFSPLEPATETNMPADPLANVRVVPDPYVVTNSWETSEFGKKLMFNNLPAECSIRIYTLVGEFVAAVEHGPNGGTDQGYAFWDMRTRNDQFIAPGVYLYHIEAPGGHEKLGRFLVIK